jgi:hypothetical protein
VFHIRVAGHQQAIEAHIVMLKLDRTLMLVTTVTADMWLAILPGDSGPIWAVRPMSRRANVI